MRAGDAIRLYRKFITIWRGYFGKRERERLVFLRPARLPDDDDDAGLPSKPSKARAPPKPGLPEPTPPRDLPPKGKTQDEKDTEEAIRR